MIRLRSGAAYRSDKKVKHKDLALILLVNILWSSNFLAAKVGLEEFPPLFFTATKTIGGQRTLFGYLSFLAMPTAG